MQRRSRLRAGRASTNADRRFRPTTQPTPSRAARGRALIADELAEAALALVRAKCLYPLEVQAGERAGPYSDEAATGTRSRTATRRAHAPRGGAEHIPQHSVGERSATRAVVVDVDEDAGER
jgi:hypothetical protein